MDKTPADWADGDHNHGLCLLSIVCTVFWIYSVRNSILWSAEQFLRICPARMCHVRDIGLAKVDRNDVGHVENADSWAHDAACGGPVAGKCWWWQPFQQHRGCQDGTLSVFACLEVMTGGVSQFLLAGQSSFVIPAGVCLLWICHSQRRNPPPRIDSGLSMRPP